MEDAVAVSLGRLQALAAELGPAAGREQLQQLRSACAAALAAVGPTPGASQQKALWSAAAGLWVSAGRLNHRLPRAFSCVHQAINDRAATLQNASIAVSSGEAAADGATAAADGVAAATSRTRVVAALRQAACDLCGPLASGSLLPPDQANLVRFHFKVG